MEERIQKRLSEQKVSQLLCDTFCTFSKLQAEIDSLFRCRDSMEREIFEIERRIGMYDEDSL